MERTEEEILKQLAEVDAEDAQTHKAEEIRQHNEELKQLCKDFWASPQGKEAIKRSREYALSTGAYWKDG